MNAHSPITNAAIASAGLLRQIRAAAQADQLVGLDDLADRNPAVLRSNLRRSLQRLADDGLVETRTAIEGGVDCYHLTEAGARAVLALDIAEGLADAGIRAAGDPPQSTEPERCSIDQLYPNPDNPGGERDEDAEQDEALAASILEAGDILQPLLVDPPDASGARMIVFGHRRWRIARRLRDEGLLPAALVFGLPIRERQPAEGETEDQARANRLVLAIMENHQRLDVSPWQDAQALLKLSELEGLSARAVAFRVGRASPGSETGVKNVQEKIKVAKEATKDNVRRHLAGEISFKDLIGTLSPGLSAKQQLLLVEMADVAWKWGDRGKGRVDCRCLDPYPHGGSMGLVEARLCGFQYFRGSVSFDLHAEAWEVLAQLGGAPVEGEDEASRQDRLHRFRRKVVSEARAEEARAANRYITKWLNVGKEAPQAAKPEPAETAPLPPLSPHFNPAPAPIAPAAPATPPEPPPGKPAIPQLDDACALALVELGDAVTSDAANDSAWAGSASRSVRIGRYWLYRSYQVLTSLGLVVGHHNAETGGKPYAALTILGCQWLAEHGWPDDEPRLRANLLAACGFDPDRAAPATDWLNLDLLVSGAELVDDREPEASEPAEADLAPAPVQDPPPAVTQAETDAFATLWLAAGETLSICRDLDGASIDGAPVPDERWSKTLYDLQMALMTASAAVPQAVRDKARRPSRPDIEPPARVLFTLREGQVVGTGGAQTYRLLDRRKSGKSVAFDVQSIRNGKDYGKPRGIYLADIRSVEEEA